MINEKMKSNFYFYTSYLVIFFKNLHPFVYRYSKVTVEYFKGQMEEPSSTTEQKYDQIENNE